MPFESSSPVDARLQGAPPTLTPKLLIPCEPGYGSIDCNGDQMRFPDLHAIKARRNASPARQLNTFSIALSCAVKRAWIIDPYLLDPDKDGDFKQRTQEVLSWFEFSFGGVDVKILTNRKPSTESYITEEFRKAQERVNRTRGRLARPLEMKLHFTLDKFPYIHDRFAIIDDELWHFGATVGGFHSAVNAASRGWHVQDHDASEFFEMALAGDSDLTGNK